MSVQIRQSINYLLATNYLCWIIFAVVTVCCIVVPIARSMFNTSKQRQVLMLTKNTACWCGHCTCNSNLFSRSNGSLIRYHCVARASKGESDYGHH